MAPFQIELSEQPTMKMFDFARDSHADILPSITRISSSGGTFTNSKSEHSKRSGYTYFADSGPTRQPSQATETVSTTKLINLKYGKGTPSSWQQSYVSHQHGIMLKLQEPLSQNEVHKSSRLLL